MLKNENIICISTMNWDFLWTRKQRFMDMLAMEGNKILYVEPTVSLAAMIRRADKPLKANFLPMLRKVRDNLYILTPSLMIPLRGKFEFIKNINQIIFIWQVRWAKKKLNFQNPILWTYVPVYHRMRRKFNEKLFIYDCVDEHSAYPGVNKKLIQKAEIELIKNADLVFMTAKGLYENKKNLNKNMFVIPNGVDVDNFKRALNDDTVIPEEILNLPKPIIGYVGGISDWIDLDLIYYVAKSNPNWSLVLVGPVDDKVNLNYFKNENKSVQNIYFLGRKTANELPNYLKGFDVCINPFKINELSKTVNPLKVYEYLAAGKPIVSVDMPEVRILADVIKIAQNREEFIAFIEESLDRNDREQILKRIQKAKNYSWNSLFNEVIGYIEKAFSNEKVG